MSLTNQIKFIYVERERIKQIHQPTIQPSNEQTKKKKSFNFSSLCLHTQAPGLLMRLLNFIALKCKREKRTRELKKSFFAKNVQQKHQSSFSIKLR